MNETTRISMDICVPRTQPTLKRKMVETPQFPYVVLIAIIIVWIILVPVIYCVIYQCLQRNTKDKKEEVSTENHIEVNRENYRGAELDIDSLENIVGHDRIENCVAGKRNRTLQTEQNAPETANSEAVENSANRNSVSELNPADSLSTSQTVLLANVLRRENESSREPAKEPQQCSNRDQPARRSGTKCLYEFDSPSKKSVQEIEMHRLQSCSFRARRNSTGWVSLLIICSFQHFLFTSENKSPFREFLLSWWKMSCFLEFEYLCSLHSMDYKNYFNA